ncbi:MAG: hypothetical protein ACJ8FY_25475 [Gemmataceae bacterium]
MSGPVSSSFDLMVPHGKLLACIELLEEGLQALRKTPYHEVLGRDFLHQTDAAADYLINFHRKASATIDVAAIYFEMNGFTINPNQWHFDAFAYVTAGSIWELEWLADWQSDTGGEEFVLTGMETVQKAFADWYYDQSQPLSVKIAEDLADHLVNARFMQLIAAAHGVAKRKYKALNDLPILATAHDWDTVHQTR